MEIIFKKNSASDVIFQHSESNEIALIEWLKKNTILKNNAVLKKYEDIDCWKRNGAETYMTQIAITYDLEKKEYEKNIVFKAIVSINSDKALEDWKRRRMILKSGGIPVSNWYFSGNGIIVEDYYPKDHKEINDLGSLGKIAEKLDKLGFSCLNFLNDIRCDIYGNPHYLDFGFDLGEPGVNNINICQKEYFNFLYNQKKVHGKNLITN